MIIQVTKGQGHYTSLEEYSTSLEQMFCWTQ